MVLPLLALAAPIVADFIFQWFFEEEEKKRQEQYLQQYGAEAVAEADYYAEEYPELDEGYGGGTVEDAFAAYFGW